MYQLRTLDSVPGGLVLQGASWRTPMPSLRAVRVSRIVDPERRGLGLTTQQETSIGTAAGGTLVSTLVATGVIAGPVGAAIGAGIGLAAMLINDLFQPNYAKIQSSNDANQIEPVLQNNLANWLSIPTNQRYASVQAAALQVFDSAWAQYTQAVQADLSKAPDSISDRAEGSCAYHTAQCAGWNGNTYTPNGPNQSTGCCWNWFVGYRDPIANDPNVQPDSAASTSASSVSSGSTGASTSSGASPVLLLLAAALVVGAVIL